MPRQTCDSGQCHRRKFLPAPAPIQSPGSLRSCPPPCSIGPMDLPVMPPVSPMLAKSVTTIPPGRLRTEMGRLPVDLLPRRRRGGAGQPQRAAADPLLPRTGGGGQRPNCRAVRHRRRDRRRRRPRPGLRGVAAAYPSGRLAGPHAGRADSGGVHRVRPARARRRRLHRPTLQRTSRRPGRRAGRRRPSRSTSLRRPPTATSPSGGSPSSREPASTASSPNRPRSPTSRTNESCSRSSTFAPPTASSPATGCTSPATTPSARCCSACTRPTARSPR